MSIAEAWDPPITRTPLVPPSPPRAPDTMTAFRRMMAMRDQRDQRLGRSALTKKISSAAASSGAPALFSTTAGLDPACAGRQLRELRAHAGRDPGIAPDPRRRPADRGGSHLETSAPDAGTSLHAARRHAARSAHGGCDRSDDCKTPGRQQCAGRSARGDAADDARDRRAHDVFVRHGPPRRCAARLRDGVRRESCAAAFFRSGVAAKLAEPAGFLPAPASASDGRNSWPC